MVLIDGLPLRESVGNEYEVHGYNDEIFEMQSNSRSSRLDFSSSIDLSATKGSSDLLAFLSQLPKRVGEHVATLVVAATAKTGTSMGASPRPKKHPVPKETRSPPLITLPRYTQVDGEVGTYFYRYNHESDLLNLLSWLPVSTITDPELCLVPLHIVWSDVTTYGVRVHEPSGDEQRFLLHL